MTTPAPHTVLDMTVALDYGQFSLCGDPATMPEYMTLLRDAQDGPGVASDGWALVVVSPHQNNFVMPLRIEQWAQEPPRDDEDWEQIVESGLSVAGGVLYYDSPTLGAEPIPVPDEEYALRISGRGFVSRGWPGSTEPGDHWRVQLWPATGELHERRLKQWQPPA